MSNPSSVFVAGAVAFAVVFGALEVGSPDDARAADTAFKLGEVAAPPLSSGVDRAAFRSAAEVELRGMDSSRLRKRRTVIVSVAVGDATQSPFAYTVNALLRDAKTGTMLAIIEGRATVDGGVSPEVRKQVLRAALRNAVRQIPDALASN